ncbi:hypothetical protein [Streptomyces sp. NBC_00470]|uniref:hypothetical protein n=1 Tax=Streptomyces sp. NBC_00470 TaxID=2975753 RepID=UPI002F90A386
MPEKTPEKARETVTVYLTRGQRDVYLYDWDHHGESDDADHKNLYYAIASRITAVPDEQGKRRMRAVVTVTRAQACDLLTNIEYSINLLNASEAKSGDGDPNSYAEKAARAARTRIRHHEAARKVVRAAGAETIAEFNARNRQPPRALVPAA